MYACSGGQKLNEVILVGGSTRIPAVQRLMYAMTGVVPRQTINPDEAVSLGAAVMAGIIDGDVQGMQVMSAWQAAIVRTIFEQKQQLSNTEIFKSKDNTKVTSNSDNNDDDDVIMTQIQSTSTGNSSVKSRLRTLRRSRTRENI